MSQYLKKLVSLPVQKLAEYLLDRFLGKFVGKIDLNREGTSFNKETLTLPDLNLNCRVLNENLSNTPLKFVKFHIGTLNLKVLNLRNGQIQVSIKDVQIDLELQDQTFAKMANQKGSDKPGNGKPGKMANSNKQKELFLVDMLVSNVLTNLELNVENVAIRVVTREAQHEDEKIPTFLIRTHAISFQRNKSANEPESPTTDKKIDPLLPMSDLQCLLGNKKFAVSDISVHFMKEKWLDPLEHLKPGQFNTHLNAFSFPFEYPTLNHPSTILLIKQPLGVKEIAKQSVQNSIVKMKDTYEFLPAMTAQFAQEEPGHLSCSLDVPLFEVQLSIGQLKQINRFTRDLSTMRQDLESQPDLNPSQSSQPSQPSQENHSNAPSQQLSDMKEDFASTVVQQNPELMASMHEMLLFNSSADPDQKEQQYLMYSSINDGGATTLDYETPPLIGKGDGYSNEAALKDSFHPQMVDLQMSTNSLMRSNYAAASNNSSMGALSNMPQPTSLPVKQPVNQIKVSMRLGEFQISVLGSEDSHFSKQSSNPFDKKQEEEAKDGLSQVVDQLIDEQGTHNNQQSGEAPSVIDMASQEASPFALEHDRVFKAFGEQTNADFPLQKFHQPARSLCNQAQIKSSWLEFAIKEAAFQMTIVREREQTKSIKLQGDIQHVIGQRIDAILDTKDKQVQPNLIPGGILNNTSLMDMSLLSDADSERFHSCYTHNNDSTVYHDTSQFGMGSLQVGESVADPLLQQQMDQPHGRHVKNFFVFNQLTETVNKFTSMGEYHLCKSTFFEIVKLNKDPQKCVQFSLAKTTFQQEGTKTETKAFVGKVFLNLGDSEILFLLSLKAPPQIDQPQQKQPREETKNNKDKAISKVKTGLQIDGLELDFRFLADSHQAYSMLSAITQRECSAQNMLAQCPCSCSSTKLKSLGLNTSQMNLILMSDKQPCFKLRQADLVAKSFDSAPITLLTLNNLIIRIGPLLESAQKPGGVDCSRLSEDSFTMANDMSKLSNNQSIMTINQVRDPAASLTNDSEVMFHRESSSYDDQRDHEERRSSMRQSFHYNPSSVHQIDQPCQNQLAIRIQQLAILLDHKDILGPILEHCMQIEAQVKNLLNVVDTLNVTLMDRVSEKELFFINKKNKIAPSLQVELSIDDITLQAIIDDKEAFKLRIDQSSIEFHMQDRGKITNFFICAKLRDIMFIDQMQTIYSHFESSSGAEEPSRQYTSSDHYLTFAQELDHANGFLLIHPSQEIHARPMVAFTLELSFLNQGFMEERISLASLKTLINNKHNGVNIPYQQICRQLSMDFAEMKKNPAQVICTVLVSHVAITISNQNLNLQQKVTKLAKKVCKTADKLRKAASQVSSQKENGDAEMTPSASPNLDTKFQLSHISLQVRDLTILYTPVVANFKLLPQNEAQKLSNVDKDKLVRANCSVALQLNHLKLEMLPKKKSFEIWVRSIALHYLTEPNSNLYASWRLQGRVSEPNQAKRCSTSQQELQKRGFVPIIALNDFHMLFKSMQLAVKLNQVSLAFAEDSLSDFVAFLNLVKMSVSDDLSRLEDELFDQTLPLDQSQQNQTALLASQSNKGGHSNELSLIQEQSLRHEESFMLRTGDQNSSLNSSTKHVQDADSSVLFGEEHPFRHISDDNNQDDVFTISVNSTQQHQHQKLSDNHQSVQQKRKQNINLLAMVDQKYFAQPAESQMKLDQQRYRKIHALSEQMKNMVCSLSFSFELGSVRFMLFNGKDFDFSLPSLNKTKEESKLQPTKQRNVAQSSTNLAQTLLLKKNNNQFSGLMHGQSQLGLGSIISPSKISKVGKSSVLGSRQQVGGGKGSEVMLLEDNYMDENELAQDDTSAAEGHSRPRNQHRKHNLFLKLEVLDLIVTRRHHFPDKVLFEELKQSKTKVPSRGFKFKTFALSARDFQIQLSSRKGTQYLLESPYSFRNHNISEVTVQSKKSYEQNIEEHSILLFIRPSKLTVNRDAIDFIEKLTRSTLAKSMGHLKTQQSATTFQQTNQEDFQIIQDEEFKQGADGQLGEENDQDNNHNNEDNDLNAAQSSKRTKQLIRNLVIKETSITVSLSLNKMISFQNLTIPIREFRLQKSQLSQLLVVDQAPGLPINSVQDCVIKFYKEDIMSKQKLAILKSFRPVQDLTYFGGSVLSPLYKPLISGYQFGLNGFLVGLSEGFGDLYTLLADGTYDWGVYLVQIRQ